MKRSWLDVGKGMGVLGSIALRLSIEVKREGGKETTYDLADVWCDLSGRNAPQPKTFGCLLGPISMQAFTSSTIGLLYYDCAAFPTSLPSNANSAPQEMCVVSHCNRQSNSFVKVSSLPDAFCSFVRRWSGRRVRSGKYRTGHVIQYPSGRAQTTLLTTLCPVPQGIRETWSVGSTGYARCFVRF
jgi:hypothetical protein